MTRPSVPVGRRGERAAAASLLAICLATPLRAQGPPDPRAASAAVDSIFAAAIPRGSPGCAVAVGQGGAVLLERGYGMASLEQQVPITPATVFDIGSVSKQFTAMAVQLLARDGRLRLDDSVRRYVPELPAHAAGVTLRHLLHQTSGLRDYVELFPLAGVQYETVVRPADALALLARQRGTNFRPGDEWGYSNTNYFLLALVVERAGGRPLGEVLRERVFQPLGMASARLWERHTQVVPNRAASYAPAAAGGFEGVVYDWETVGDGAIQSTAGDMLRWLDALASPRGAVGDSALVARLETPGALNDGTPIFYAQGMLVTRYRGLRRVWHNGAAAGFRAHVERFPERRLSVVTLCNLASINPAQLTLRVADVYLGTPPVAAAAPPAPAAPAATGASAGAAAAAQPHRFAALAGVYFSEQNGLTRRLRARDGRLTWSAGGPEVDLVAAPPDAGDSVLQLAGRPARVRLRADPRQAPRMDELVPGLGPTRYARVADTAALAPAALAAYAGDYASDELPGTTWRVRPYDGGLVLRVGGLAASDDTLHHDFADGFSSGMAVIRFDRDRAGRVTGLRVWTRAVRGLSLPRTAALAQLSAPAPAQRPEGAAFVTTLGQDTVAVERYTRTADRIEGDIALRTPRARSIHYVAHLDRAGRVGRFELVSRFPGSPADSAPLLERYATLTDSALTLEVRRSGQADTASSGRFVARPTALPIVQSSSAFYEQMVRQARAAGADSMAVEQYLFGPKPLFAGYVRVSRDGSAELGFGGPPLLARVDAAGRLLSVSARLTTVRTETVRVPESRLDVARVAQGWLARERASGAPGLYSARDTVRATLAGGGALWVDYGRPARRGRRIFGALVPWDSVWRTGANAATQLHSDVDLLVGGAPVPAGTYTLWTVPTPRGATLIVNKQSGQWGTQYDSTQDLVRIPMRAGRAARPAERFTIAVDPPAAGASTLRLTWDAIEYSVPLAPR